MEYTLIATAPLGLEAVVAREVRQLGYETSLVENGRVFYQTDLLGIARSNLWLRAADRVMLVVGQFTATTFEHLFEQTKALPWGDLLPLDARFPVEGRAVKSQLMSVPACQAIVKKAVVSHLEERYRQSWFEETGPEYAIEVALLKDEVTLALDTSGLGLHKRGYRSQTGPAPLKETLAASMILLSRWGAHRPFADPLCGTGAIAIEAALLAKNIAPGFNRTFASESFAWIGSDTFAKARQEVRDSVKKIPDCHIYAFDIDPQAIAFAEQHAANARVKDVIRFGVQSIHDFAPDHEYGCIVTNPPYGERMGNDAEVRQLYQEMGNKARMIPTWSWFVITSHPSFERLFGKRAEKNRKLYNGRIECHLYQYLGPLPPRPYEK